MTTPPVFARDPATAAYYEQRAREYDEWYEGNGRFSERDRPGWADEVQTVVDFVRSLPAARTLDVACGSGFLTRHLRGFVVGLDQSRTMVELTRSRLPDGMALSWPTHWRYPSPTARSTASSPVTSTATCRPTSGTSSWPRPDASPPS